MVLDSDQVKYLLSLIRADIRKRRRNLGRFAPRRGQDAAEAAAVLAGFQASLVFRERAYRTLGGDPDLIAGTEPGAADDQEGRS